MKKIAVVFVVALFSMSFAACGGGGGAAGSDSAAVSPPATCSDYLANAERVAVKRTDLPEQLPEIKKIADSMARHAKAAALKSCQDDAWSAEILTCGATATDSAGVAACQGKLTADQATKLTIAVTVATKTDLEALVKAMTPPMPPTAEDPTAGGGE